MASLNPETMDKRQLREQIQKDTREYIANGGKPEYVPIRQRKASKPEMLASVLVNTIRSLGHIAYYRDGMILAQKIRDGIPEGRAVELYPTNPCVRAWLGVRAIGRKGVIQ